MVGDEVSSKQKEISMVNENNIILDFDDWKLNNIRKIAAIFKIEKTRMEGLKKLCAEYEQLKKAK